MDAEDLDGGLEDLLRLLEHARGFDFTGYKRATLARRIGRRMDALGLRTYGEYRDRLEAQPEEYQLLFDSLLIRVTGFFRDPSSWQALRERVLPELVTAKGPDAAIRVWSAGCATGEEAYTLAVVLAETLGVEQFRQRVKIYATDLDERALQVARTGTYGERTLRDVPEELRERYFEPAGRERTFRRDLRRRLVFGRSDLASDAPISRVDLLAARNTLMYFGAETRARVVRRFHFALSDPGFLFLGRAELLLGQGDLFEPVDLRTRLFRKLPPVPSGAVSRPAPRPGRGRSPSRPQAAAPATDARAEELFGPRPQDEELERAYEELEMAREELETAREELETANEELQSTNEELGTMNEELQSTNDAFQEINEALRLHSEELDRTNLFLESVLGSLGDAVVVLGRDLRVEVWSPGAEELWGLRPEDAEGRHLLGLDIGLPVGDLASLLRQTLVRARGEPLPVTVDAVDRRGRSTRLDAVPRLLRDVGGHVSGVILVMDRAGHFADAPAGDRSHAPE